MAAAEPAGNASRGQQIREGRLDKRSSGILKQDFSWKEKHFVLYENALSYYAKSGDKRAGQEPRQEIRITADSEVSDFPDRKRILAFRVVTGNKFLVVSATNDEEFKRWKQDIGDRIEALKRMASEQSTGSRKGTNQMQVVSAAGQDFEMNSRYEMIRPIGHGAYGVVISALDHELNLKVAIKKIPNTFEDLVDAKRIVREIRLLRHFDHDNVIRVVNLFTPQPHSHFDDVYIVSDLMETDLHRVIYSRQRLTPEHIQFFLYQMLCGLKYIHSGNVLHRDLKPSNILLNANCDLKLCDFGLSRGTLNEDSGANLTEYVVTRWYRAPEIMLSCQDYGTGIDVWSIGCIFGEMLGRKAMFPGNDYIHQLKLIMNRLGTPSEADLWFVRNQKARNFVLGLPHYEAQNLSKLYPHASAQAIDLLQQILVVDPSKRITVDDALAHPYLADVRDLECEQVSTSPIEWDDIESLRDETLNRENLQRLLIQDFASMNAIDAERRSSVTAGTS